MAQPRRKAMKKAALIALSALFFAGQALAQSDSDTPREHIKISHCNPNPNTSYRFLNPNTSSCEIIEHESKDIGYFFYTFLGIQKTETGFILEHADESVSEIAMTAEIMITPASYSTEYSAFRREGVTSLALGWFYTKLFMTEYPFPIYSDNRCKTDCFAPANITIEWRPRLEATIPVNPEWERIIIHSITEQVPIRICGTLHFPSEQATLGALLRELQTIRLSVDSIEEIAASVEPEESSESDRYTLPSAR